MTKLWFFASATWQSQRTHPLLFAVITKQIMAECQDNFQIIASVPEKDNILEPCPLQLLFFISADGGCAVAPSSIAPLSELEPIILCPSSGEIQFHHQTVVLAINKDWLIPSGLFFSPCLSVMRLHLSLF